MGCTYFREQLYMCMCMYIFNPRTENLKFSKDIHQQNPSWMLFGWDVNLAVPCTSVNAGQVRSHTWGKCVRCCGLLLSLITSSINIREQQVLALEGCTFHTYVFLYIWIWINTINDYKLFFLKQWNMTILVFGMHHIWIMAECLI